MNENINLVEILRDCPKGLRLYSPIYGDVDYSGINEGHKYPIVVTLATGNTSQFSSRGRVSEEYPQAECTLFPSNEMRDWRKFFKRGDVLVSIGLHTFYAIFKEYDDESCESFTAAFFAQEECHPKKGDKSFFTTEFSLATEEQKAFFFSEIEEEFGGRLYLDTFEIEKEYISKPFGMVLVRDDDGDIWKCDFFSHYNGYRYECINKFYMQCISYKGNEHLLGTKISPEHE